VSLMIEKSICLVSDSGAGLYADPSLDAMRAGAAQGTVVTCRAHGCAP